MWCMHTTVQTDVYIPNVTAQMSATDLACWVKQTSGISARNFGQLRTHKTLEKRQKRQRDTQPNPRENLFSFVYCFFAEGGGCIDFLRPVNASKSFS